MRQVACRALGEILLRTKAKTVPEESYNNLVGGLRDDDARVRAACGAALGMSPIKAEERYKALVKGRVNPRGDEGDMEEGGGDEGE